MFGHKFHILFLEYACTSRPPPPTPSLSRPASAFALLGLVQIRAIVVGMSRLTSLRLDGCPKLSRSYIHRVATQLPFVMPAKDYFGFQALPDAEERIAATDIRRKQVCMDEEVGGVYGKGDSTCL
jgi:hypothetical protein